MFPLLKVWSSALGPLFFQFWLKLCKGWSLTCTITILVVTHKRVIISTTFLVNNESSFFFQFQNTSSNFSSFSTGFSPMCYSVLIFWPDISYYDNGYLGGSSGAFICRHLERNIRVHILIPKVEGTQKDPAATKLCN